MEIKKVEIVFFSGCPLMGKAREALRSTRLPFSEVNQDHLPAGHPYRFYSSPSILVNGQLMIGSRAKASVCSILDWEEVPSTMASKLKTS